MSEVSVECCFDSSKIHVDRTSSTLNINQRKRLLALLDRPILISSQSTLPILTVIPWRFLVRFQFEAKQRNLEIENIRLSGGAASFIVDPHGDFVYRDLDFFISIANLRSDESWTKLKQAVFCALPIVDQSNELYAEKIIRIVNDQDRWALISLRNANGRNLELKFVEHMKREYQFSVDSFQICLDSLLNRSFNDIIVRSSYGNIFEAFQHLQHRLIAVKAPEELRGGGLLKYCDLIARGFRPSHKIQMKDLQRYMCSRFFIDFRDSTRRSKVLFDYLTNHLPDDDDVRYRFLRCLYEIISHDRLCLSAFERFSFLRTISSMNDCSISTTRITNQKHRYETLTPTSINQHSFGSIPSVPNSNELIQNSSDQTNEIVLVPSFSIEQIDLFVEIVQTLRGELFPKLNLFLTSLFSPTSNNFD